jgi:hypothetical protein
MLAFVASTRVYQKVALAFAETSDHIPHDLNAPTYSITTSSIHSHARSAEVIAVNTILPQERLLLVKSISSLFGSPTLLPACAFVCGGLNTTTAHKQNSNTSRTAEWCLQNKLGSEPCQQNRQRWGHAINHPADINHSLDLLSKGFKQKFRGFCKNQVPQLPTPLRWY